MLIFKDIFTGDEMFTDSYKYKLVDDVLYEVYGKHVSRKLGDVQLAGSNPSAEEADEGCEEAVESGVDIVLNQRLQEAPCFSDKKAYLGYLKDYMKNVAEKLKDTNPSEVDTFKTKANEAVKKLLPRFKDFQFYTGESYDTVSGMVAILDYKEIDGEEAPVLLFFKHGLQEEKYWGKSDSLANYIQLEFFSTLLGSLFFNLEDSTRNSWPVLSPFSSLKLTSVLKSNFLIYFDQVKMLGKLNILE